MKKILTALLLAACLAVPVIAQETSSDTSETTKAIWDHGDNVSPLSYYKVPIYQIWDQKDAYVVFYQKQDLKVGTITVPKTWANKESRKLQFRNRPKQETSTLTVYYKDGEFHKVVLTVSPSRQDSVWSTAPNGTKIDANVETIDFKL